MESSKRTNRKASKKTNGKRHPLSDTGLMIALSVLVCLGIRSVMFEMTIVSVVWMFMSLIYIVASVFLNSWNKPLRWLSSAYLLSSVLIVVGMILFDRPAMPMFVGFHDEVLDDTVVSQSQLKINGPEPIVIDTMVADTVLLEEIPDSTLNDSLVAADVETDTDVPEANAIESEE